MRDLTIIVVTAGLEPATSTVSALRSKPTELRDYFGFQYVKELLTGQI